MADFQLEIYTPEKLVYEGEVTALTAPGEEGYFGVLAHHAPLLANLGEGKLTLRRGSQITQYSLSGGFIEVHGNKATMLADSLEPLA